MDKALVVFQGKDIRRIWHDEAWYFSIADVISVLTESSIPRRYWSDLKIKLKEEGFELYDKIVQLKLASADGKKYETDCANTETIFRLIQSIPSPKAEPFKLWLAKVGYERIKELTDPEISLDRARENWQKYGRSEKWIQQRMMSQETRNKLTDYWKDHEVTKEEEYAILTNIIHQEWTGLTVQDHKKLKKLQTQNLRDHMSEAELIFTALAELSTRQIAQSTDATGLDENKVAGKKGGHIAKRARKELEKKTGKKVVTGENFRSEPESQKRIGFKKKKSSR